MTARCATFFCIILLALALEVVCGQTVCQAGYGSNVGSNSSQCLPCPAGQYEYYYNCYNCSVGYYSEPASQTCLLCPDGTVADFGSANCSTCPSGLKPSTRSYPWKSAECDCSLSYQQKKFKNGTYVCESCPMGTQMAMISYTVECTTCPAGTSSWGSNELCHHCLAGTIAPRTGSYSCQPCPADSISISTIACSRCPEGQVANSTLNKCITNIPPVDFPLTQIIYLLFLPMATFIIGGGGLYRFLGNNKAAHIDCLLLSFGVWCFFIATITSFAIPDSSIAARITNPVLFVCLVCGYLRNCHLSTTAQSCYNRCTVASTVKSIDQMRSSSPILLFHVQCYHWTVITTTKDVSDGKGGTTAMVEKRPVKVPTYSEVRCFQYNGWSDVSDSMLDLGTCGRPVRLQITKSIDFATPEMHEAYVFAKAKAFTENKDRDTHCEVTEVVTFAGYMEQILVCEEHVFPFLMSSNGFWLFAFLLLSWPHRVWLHLNTATASFHLKKRIS